MYEDKKVSVIVPIFNCDKYLNDSMGDVLRQTHKTVSYTHLTLPTILRV